MSVVVVKLDVDARWAVGRQAQLRVLERDVALCVLELQLLR